MKILFFTYDLPYPLDSGGKIRAYHLLWGLSKNHQITLFSFYRKGRQLQYLDEIKKLCHKVKLFKRRKLFSPLNLFFLPFFPFPAALYYSPKIKRELKKELQREKYQVLHVESFYPSIYLDRSFKTPLILGTENIEWKVYFEYAKQQKLPLLRKILCLEAFRVRQFEENTFRKADVCLAVSKENAGEIEKNTGKKCYVIPNGVDLKYFKFNQEIRNPEGKKTILFVGNFKYIQNQDAASALVKEVFPLIKKEIKNVKLLIVGKNPTREIKSLAAKDVLVESKIEDIREAYSRADVLLAPIRAGSGTKFKILEAMATGIPVVTTAVGSEGIKAQDGSELLIREKTKELAKATIELVENEDLRYKLTTNARRLVEKKYSWEKITRELETVYRMFEDVSKN